MAAYERIFLTGGAGFVGSHVAAALAAAYPDARRAILLRPGETGANPAFTPVAGDLLDEVAIERIVAELRPDLVVHLAGQASIGQAAKAAETTWRVNFHGAFSLGAALARHAPQAVVLFSSTAAAYGASFRDGALTEEAAVRPMDVYSRSKVAAESALGDVIGEEARLIVARPVNHSGPGQRSRNFVLASFAAQIAAIEAGEAEPRMKVGDLSKARDFLDVRDVVDAYMRLIARARDLPERVSIFNIGSGEARTIASLLEEMRALARVPFEVEVDPKLLRPSGTDIASVACDATKLRKATGWRPRFSARDMLGALLDEWRAAVASGQA
ncbi:NAD-dependent epimerase/dehydratase family protein [Methylocystis parvus]|uniref:NAD-dependent epimerase/dehydratase family protein n=1 Tax=Methylocystis parvus TaxID=134 RepID=A0A6B8M797_9HYPH|nr:NAD-dependent epimerase/dehydratase family protein [Methylocystis parvus]QGM97203.1 NAD-dependent epimerase/dehydratase family protein [Methylocystis parvus]WBJ98890.1 GDP-mannose 4,6-dehydratase [Methylocystis parvus OBBP]